MELHFEPITQENRKAAETLQVHPWQNGFIESVAECLEEADGLEAWRPVGIYHGPALVGFAMYGLFGEGSSHRVWLDRLLIGSEHQGKGYGAAAAEQLLKRLKLEYGPEPVYLSVYDDNHVAIDLYHRLGFSFTGELDSHGEKVMILQPSR